jgi:hypothetical protein
MTTILLGGPVHGTRAPDVMDQSGVIEVPRPEGTLRYTFFRSIPLTRAQSFLETHVAAIVV